MESRYSVGQYSVQDILGWIKTSRISIPEIQRPFVWSTTKVRDLIDSLYKGYPVGYLITWQSRAVRLKSGTGSADQQILIDGQQRVTALTAALAGQQIVTKDYRRQRIQIAFNPVTEEFATFTPILRNDPQWLIDVAEAMAPGASFHLIASFLERNPDVDRELVIANITRLVELQTAQVGAINLAEHLDIETVTEIFVRINSAGARLTPADFAMSKIASWGEQGATLRKYIDYFCHLSVAPHFYRELPEIDPEFAETPYYRHLEWLQRDSSDLYDPTYQDVLRVAGLLAFERGQMSAVVGLLSGRDFETRTFSDAIAQQSFDQLEKALDMVTSEHEFKQFRLILASAGYDSKSYLSATNAVNFAYALYLRLRRDGIDFPVIQSVVRRWFVMSMLTGRHSGSFESQWDQDFRRIGQVGAETVLSSIERSDLTSGFWEEGLVLALDTSSTRNPQFLAFLAAQNQKQSRGFLSRFVRVGAMVGDVGQGDIHHLFPKAYLSAHGVTDRSIVNQVGNYVVAETPVNIRIGKDAPSDYMARVRDQIAAEHPDVGEIVNAEDLAANFTENAIPHAISHGVAADYPDFLIARRRAMASFIRDFYQGLS